ncbi:MAG: sigma-70 family RNA polymerase sigma factor [Bacteroidota bacterium]
MQQEWQEIQAAQANPAQFRTLYDRYYAAIFHYIYRRTQQEALTADLCSQVFLKALQHLGKYQFRGVPFSAWLYQIARNEIAQHFRHSQKRRVVSVDDANLSEMIAEIEEDDQEALRDALIRTLDDLKAADLELIELRFFEQRAFKEIAQILNISESNAKVRTYRLLGKLKKKLQAK